MNLFDFFSINSNSIRLEFILVGLLFLIKFIIFSFCRIVRIHGPYVSEFEIEKVNSFLRSQGKPNYIDEITITKDNEIDNSGNDNNKKDELYFKALDIIKLEKRASTSFLQRKLQIGYNRAARIMEMMEKEGVVGQANHVGKREIL